MYMYMYTYIYMYVVYMVWAGACCLKCHGNKWACAYICAYV